jgi:AraC-like DNA-binding protein
MENKKYLKERAQHGTPLFPLNVYENIFVYNGVFPFHWHDEFEILYVENGVAKFYVDGNYYTLTNNQFLFVNCGSIHAGEEVDNPTAYAIVFNLNMLFSIESDICKYKYLEPLQNGKIYIPTFIKDEILGKNIYDIIIYFKNKPYGYELIIKGLLFTIFFQIYNKYLKENNTKRKYSCKIEKIKGVLDYINMSYQEEITLDSLSNVANLNKFYLCRIFREVLHLSPIEYINKIRVEKASELLRNTDMSISEIAFEVGYNNISYFIKNFKKFMNITPLQYRKKLQMELETVKSQEF